MTELERYKEAQVHLFNVLNSICSRSYVERVAEEIDAILTPPEFEEVELVRWGAWAPETGWIDTETYATEEMAGSTGHQVVRIPYGTYLRPKPRPVERSVSVKTTINSFGEPLNTADGLYANLGSNDPDCIGKTGTLTFTWTEEAPK